jgi:hypothetical protein
MGGLFEAKNSLFGGIFYETVAPYEKVSKNVRYATGEPKLSLLDKIMAAITFAEAGEHETAREIIEKIDGNKKNYQKNKTDILYSQNK